MSDRDTFTRSAPGGEAGEPERVVIRDRRRFEADGTPRPAAEPVAVPAEAVDVPAEPVTDQVAELTGDLQRVTAEYANYRKRVDRDRALVVEMATAGLLEGLLPLLDDIDRAREHGDLTGGFKGVGEGLEQIVTRLGLERYAEPGEPFDPALHEAVMAAEPDPAAAVAVCRQVFQQGFRLRGGRILRPARVSVAEPGAAAPAGTDTGSGTATGTGTASGTATGQQE